MEPSLGATCLSSAGVVRRPDAFDCIRMARHEYAVAWVRVRPSWGLLHAYKTTAPTHGEHPPLPPLASTARYSRVHKMFFDGICGRSSLLGLASQAALEQFRQARRENALQLASGARFLLVTSKIQFAADSP